ncbi:DUF6318 family protein [Arthrobacter gengyunqii]|uniref:DUF6318 family protein n=1 Tax=Arthrobacter gengyunqii TaxID=2886940 RepID=A0ABS8GHE9_9MICC|nr:DUF6318 family protein [Arthrobacter gengyunqii]MCC3265427.1 DUF6318 family protein [Arthrobacter gengyunqii]
MIRTSIRPAVPAARLGVLGLAAILVLGGCSGSGEPNAEAAENSSSSPSASESSDPTESASPSATPTPTAAYKPATAEGPAENVPLPVMPELAKEESKEGLEAFAKYWYTTIDYGFETGDLEPFKAINGPDCIVCASVFDIVGPGYRNEDWITGGKLEVIGTQTTYTLTSTDQYQILVQLRQDPYEYRGPSGHLYEKNDGLSSTTVHLIEAIYLDDHWFANNVVAID